MLQIAIVEDEADLAQQTKDNVVRYLNEHGLEGNIAVFNDGMDIAENYKPIWDILLLDIEMPLLNGMSAAQKIREQDATVVMIFITRMAKYAIKGYEVDALDFILKPITYAQLSMKLPRAIERASQRQKHHLFVTVNGEKQRIESSAIYYIEVRGHWLYLHLHNQTLEVSGSLQEAGERISAVKLLLDQLFEFVRIEADELKLNCRNTDIHSVLRDVVASYYGDFEQKKCVPYIVIPNPPAIIWGDPDALTRIFSNVVYNALVHGEGNYQITAAIEEAQTVITIKNASSSIQQEDIPHLFDRFYTTDQSRTKKTTGLGLAIAQRLVTRMGGQIVASLQNGIFAIQVVFPIVNS